TGRRRRRPAGGGRTHGGARMIVTLTPNPSVDRTIEVDALHRGAVLRARSSRVAPGWRGVRENVRGVEPGGTVTKVNEPGPQLTPGKIEAVPAATAAPPADAEW